MEFYHDKSASKLKMLRFWQYMIIFFAFIVPLLVRGIKYLYYSKEVTAQVYAVKTVKLRYNEIYYGRIRYRIDGKPLTFLSPEVITSEGKRQEEIAADKEENGDIRHAIVDCRYNYISMGDMVVIRYNPEEPEAVYYPGDFLRERAVMLICASGFIVILGICRRAAA